MNVFYLSVATRVVLLNMTIFRPVLFQAMLIKLLQEVLQWVETRDAQLKSTSLIKQQIRRLNDFSE